MLEETVPTQNLSAFGTATNTLLACGIMIAIVLGALLPDGDDLLGMKNDWYYRVIYGFPWLFQGLSLVMFLTYYREDSIVFLIRNGDYDGAIKGIQKVYSADEDPRRVLQAIKAKSQSSDGQKDDKAEKSHVSLY